VGSHAQSQWDARHGIPSALDISRAIQGGCCTGEPSSGPTGPGTAVWWGYTSTALRTRAMSRARLPGATVALTAEPGPCRNREWECQVILSSCSCAKLDPMVGSEGVLFLAWGSGGASDVSLQPRATLPWVPAYWPDNFCWTGDAVPTR